MILTRYPGGKATIARWIVAHLPRHDRYIEGFAGAASVLLAKAPSAEEVLIEKDPWQVALLRAVRDDHLALRQRLFPLRWCRETWRDAQDRLQSGDWASDLELASLVYTLRRMSHGGCGGFSGNAGRYQQGWWDRGVINLSRIHRRLERVRIISGDCSVHPQELDSAGTCFYLDPPYVGVGQKLYGQFGLTDQGHIELCRRIRQLRGKVVLSGYPNPIYDRWLSDWRTLTRQVKVRGKGIKRPERLETVWINF